MKKNGRKNVLKLIGLFITTIFIINIFSINVLAIPPDGYPKLKDKNGNGVDDRLERINNREINYKINNDQIEISSERQDWLNKDELKFIISTRDDVLSIHTNYESKNIFFKGEIGFTYTIKSLIEYNDVDGDLQYYEDVDEIINALPVSTDLSMIINTIETASGEQLLNISVILISDIFIVNIYLSADFLAMEELHYTPNLLKIDYIISNYSFNSSESRIAICSEFIVNEEIKEKITTENEQANLSSNETGYTVESEENSELNGIFSWKNNAFVDNNLVNVSVSQNIISNEQKSHIYEIYINYPQGSLIFHDPWLGVEGIFFDNYVLTYFVYGSIIFAVLVVAIFGLTMTKAEYRDYLRNRLVYINKGPHQLTIDEVLENEHRRKIIDIVIDNPGIHYRELLRQIDTSPSNLAWHIEILIKYKVIHKQLVGNYLIFYPYLDNNPFADFNINIAKSKKTLQIYEIITENPGIYQNKIANRLEIDHKTVKYHISKLLKANLIYFKKKGRISYYYINNV